MSATNRGGEREPHDFYGTPSWCVDRLLKYADLPGGEWLEPSAGDGAIIRAVNARRTDVKWTAVELRMEGGRAIQQSDPTATVWTSDFVGLFQSAMFRKPFVACVGNPPYSLAAQFISHALTMAERVIYLLRLNFLGSQERIPFFRRVGMPDIGVFPDRPSFRNGGTDATEYCWMEFRREWAGRQLGRIQHMWPDDVVNQEELLLEA